MKLNILALGLLGLKVTGVLSAALESNVNAGLNRHIAENYAALQLECGELGVMDVPEGKHAKDVRHCAEHPEGRNRGPLVASFDDNTATTDVTDINESDERDVEVRESEAATPDQLFGRAALMCNRAPSPPWGCSGNGYCWRECMFRYGPWCWIAEGGGHGKWRTCNRQNPWNCAPDQGGECGLGCGPACGCNCE